MNYIFGLLPQYLLPYVIAIGDWNIDINSSSYEKKSLVNVAKALKLQILIPDKSTRKNSTLDFLLCGSSFQLIKTETFDSSSDHQILTYQLNINKNLESFTPIIPNTLLGKKLTIYSLNISKNAQEFLTNYNQTLLLHSNNLRITPKKSFY